MVAYAVTNHVLRNLMRGCEVKVERGIVIVEDLDGTHYSIQQEGNVLKVDGSYIDPDSIPELASQFAAVEKQLQLKDRPVSASYADALL